MATLNLQSTAPIEVDVDLDTVIYAASIPTINAYGVYFPSGESRWEAKANRIYQVTQWCQPRVASLSSTGTQELAINFRTRLFDETTGYEVPAGIQTRQEFRTFGTETFTNWNLDAGVYRGMVNFHCMFWASGGGALLIPGHKYRNLLEVKVEQAVGAPTAVVTMRDNSAFGSAAIKNL